MTETTVSKLVLLSGPPFGPDLYRGVVARLGGGEARCVIDAAAPRHGWEERAAEIARGIVPGGTILVAHGLAVPAAIAAAAAARPAALVLSNGPVRRVDPVTASLARAAAAPGGAALLARTLLRPAAWLRWLASSAGLRRAAVNPYVMDHDTVAALCGPLVASAAGRQAVASYLGSLTRLPDVAPPKCPVLLLWGDADPLYPAEEAAFLEASWSGAAHVSVPGGQHAHPEERPWEMADRLVAWLSDHGLGGPATTRMS